VAPFDLDFYASLLHSERVGRTVRYFEEAGSTMDEARAGADLEGASSRGTAYVAGRQTAGRGRQGRQWVSEPGAGLYVTYHLLPPAVAAGSTLYAVAGAMAAADAVEHSSGLETQLKWPNDLLIDGRKLGGILAEARFGERVDVFLGIGINVRAAALPPDVRDIATSIEGAGGAVPRIEELLAALSDALEARLRQLEEIPAVLVDEWRARLETMGRRVRLASPDGRVYEGEAVDVSLQGDLVLRHEDGTTDTYAAGDVTTA
jgi:BirA family biotin operon repressor/biotin-[acetyl-CoA-carboxylase] ligase